MSNKISLAEAIKDKGGKIYHQPVSEIVDYLEKHGFKHDQGGGDSNGWQHDFWEYFEHPDKGRWCLSGSLWYDDFKLTKL